MARKGRKTSDVVGRVAAALLDCPLTPDEIRTLERIESRRQEADTDMRHALTPEQKTKAYAKAAAAGAEALALAKRVSERREANWSAAALKEFDALSKLRGDDAEANQIGGFLRPSPLIRLYRAELISEAEYEAGKIYGRTYERLYGGKDGNGTGCGDLDPLETRIADLKRLDEARGYAISEVGGRKLAPTGLGGDARLIKLCDDICGAEKSLREAIGQDTRKRRRAFPMFKAALGLLALHYGLRKTREDELRAA